MKNEVIRAFIESGGRFLSGEELSELSNVSRQALWKVVEQLRKEGWFIEGVPGKGYRLESFPPHAEYELLRDMLAHRGELSDVFIFREVESTNDFLLARAETGVSCALAVADSQKSGKGRMGRRWFSPPGKNIYMSLLVPLNVPPPKTPAVTLVAGVAVATVLEEVSGIECKLKWPNDVYAGGKKLVGILTEMIAELDATRAVVIGIGVNVNMEEDDLPGELVGKATSLKILTGKSYFRPRIVKKIVDVLFEYLALFERAGFSAFADEWDRRSFLKGKFVTVISGSDKLEGEVMGVDGDRGYLLLRKSDGTVEQVLSGEILVEGET